MWLHAGKYGYLRRVAAASEIQINQNITSAHIKGREFGVFAFFDRADTCKLAKVRHIPDHT
jgi:hypothetical protein